MVLASSNAGKLGEIREIFGDLAVELVAQSDLRIPDVAEDATTFVENALRKARHAAQLSGLPALGDDSGLCVDALAGAPGLYSARYAGRHGDAQANIAKLLGALHAIPPSERSAHFHCSIVYMRSADDPAPLIAEGTWYGNILTEPRGTSGFGYDPVFCDPLHGAAGELDAQIKNRISHRSLALEQLRLQLAPILCASR